MRRVSYPLLPWVVTGISCLLLGSCGDSPQQGTGSSDPSAKTEKQEAKNEGAKKPGKDFRAYKIQLTGTSEEIEMLPIQGGEYTLGSPKTEAAHKPDEEPQRAVRIAPFWMAKCEITWNVYELWMLELDIRRRKQDERKTTERDKLADAVTRPTKPYVDMTFDMGHDGYPAISMTQKAARVFCQWLSQKTGQTYRLPTEAEWEYACRAGTKTAYSFGDDPKKLGEYAWFEGNSEGGYHKVGTKKPNPWGLSDMHGNVAEWCLDQYYPDSYARLGKEKLLVDPWLKPKELYPRPARGGSWQDVAADCRSAARLPSHPDWKMQDPQIPQSEWYHTDASFVGFRVVRPYEAKDARRLGVYRGHHDDRK